ncbi:hypothetical protein [Paraburkholderia lacunae]|uniref:hypothetical protein n=1 Tax=Paraburkholderia lacunae TaxID=2211104 RepID=UPI00105901A7|nr:hypothetical protein [Paraburkholderia lacunae]
MVTTVLLYIALAGAVGGLGNAFLSDNGMVLPRVEKVAGTATTIYRPGFLVNMFIGALAAAISWGLYGAGANASLLGTPGAPNAVPVNLTVSSLAGAILVGLGGARWLSNEVDKKLLRVAATQALDAAGATEKAQQAATGTPIQALHIAEKAAEEARKDRKPAGLPPGPVITPQPRVHVDPNKGVGKDSGANV